MAQLTTGMMKPCRRLEASAILPASQGASMPPDEAHGDDDAEGRAGERGEVRPDDGQRRRVDGGEAEADEDGAHGRRGARRGQGHEQGRGQGQDGAPEDERFVPDRADEAARNEPARHDGRPVAGEDERGRAGAGPEGLLRGGSRSSRRP